jgi:hypothetical protein
MLSINAAAPGSTLSPAQQQPESQQANVTSLSLVLTILAQQELLHSASMAIWAHLHLDKNLQSLLHAALLMLLLQMLHSTINKQQA